jgi:Flp pilus assembly protein CpaB
VKRQTYILVVIGVVLFIAGGAIAAASVIAGNKNKTPGAQVAAVTSVPVVVATAPIPLGTTGQAMQAQGLVRLQAIPAKKYVSTDLTSLGSLTNVVTTSAIAKGQAIETQQLTPSTQAISLQPGFDAVTVTMTGVQALAGYLQPGSHVDVYADVTKASTTQTPVWVPVGITVPCTELTMADIEVLDVSSTSPSLSGSGKGAAAVAGDSGGRTIPGSETLLLEVSPAQSQIINFMTENESLSVVETQKDTLPPAIGVCKGTGQYSILP